MQPCLQEQILLEYHKIPSDDFKARLIFLSEHKDMLAYMGFDNLFDIWQKEAEDTLGKHQMQQLQKSYLA
ncbi:MAG: hypothetical protein ACK5MJ_04430 [Alphaproteobacteria bacterium]